jgi:hypothetical protein
MGAWWWGAACPQVVRAFLQSTPLAQLFAALDQATRENKRELVGVAANAITRVFTSSVGPALLDDPAVLPNLRAGEHHASPAPHTLTSVDLHQHTKKLPML